MKSYKVERTLDEGKTWHQYKVLPQAIAKNLVRTFPSLFRIKEQKDGTM